MIAVSKEPRGRKQRLAVKRTWQMSSAALALFALSLGMRGQQPGGTGAGEESQARPETSKSEDGV